MGRYYDGDINGKFWFAVQDSNAADRFGVIGSEPNFISYYFHEDDLEEVRNELKRIEDELGKNLELLEKWYNNVDEIRKDLTIERYLGMADGQELRHLIREYADYTLGKQIEQSIIDKGSCYFDAELWLWN